MEQLIRKWAADRALLTGVVTALVSVLVMVGLVPEAISQTIIDEAVTALLGLATVSCRLRAIVKEDLADSE